jgi:hypothetical protein
MKSRFLFIATLLWGFQFGVAIAAVNEDRKAVSEVQNDSSKVYSIPLGSIKQFVTDNTVATLVNNELQVAVVKSPANSLGIKICAPQESWNLNKFERVGIEIQNSETTPITLSCWAVSNGWGGVGAYGIDGSQSKTATITLEPNAVGIQYLYIHTKYKDNLFKIIDPEKINYFDIRLKQNNIAPSKILIKRIFAENEFDAGSYDKSARLVVPQMQTDKPAPGKLVKQQLTQYIGTDVFHTLYLPINWQSGKKYPVIVEYAPNIFYHAACYSTGKVEDVVTAYGISKGQDYILVSLPFVSLDGKQNETNGWGSADLTTEYALKAVRSVCEEYGGDPAGIFITGFSRGAIAAGYIGLRNDEIADSWLGFIACQHTDGDGWGKSDVDFDVRIARLRGRSVFLIDNSSYPWALKVPTVGSDLKTDKSGIGAHSAASFLDNRPSTENVRAWVAATYKNKPGTLKISGSIKDKHGNPLSKVLVVSGKMHFTYSDDNGNYNLAGLISGQRILTFKRNKVVIGQTSMVLVKDSVFNLSIGK